MATVWPQGQVAMDVVALLNAGRDVAAAAQQDDPAIRRQADEVVAGLAAYTSSLPAAQQGAIAAALVKALAEPKKLESTVAPRRRAR